MPTAGLPPSGESDLMTLDKGIKLCFTQGVISFGRMGTYSRGRYVYIYIYLADRYVLLPILCQAVFKTFYKYMLTH